jgi:hypothetical protein
MTYGWGVHPLFRRNPVAWILVVCGLFSSGCVGPVSETNTQVEVDQVSRDEPAALDGEQVEPVFDPDHIAVKVRELPDGTHWSKVWAHLREVNELAELGPGIVLEAELSPTVNREKAQETIDAYTRAMGLWSFFEMETVPAVWSLMSENDYDWWYERVSAIEGAYPALDVWDRESNRMGHCYPDAYSFCGYGNPQASTGITFQYNIIGSAYRGEPNRNTVAHEAVHFYQDSLSQSYDNFMPCWFVEGQATLIGNAISGQGTGQASYGPSELSRLDRRIPGDETWSTDQWKQLLDDYFYDPEAKTECVDQEINYTFGSLIFEYLYANYTMWEIHELTKTAAETENWEAALTSHLDMTVGEFHTMLAEFLHGQFNEFR